MSIKTEFLQELGALLSKHNVAITSENECEIGFIFQGLYREDTMNFETVFTGRNHATGYEINRISNILENKND